MNNLPSTFSVRAPTPKDAQAIADLFIARDVDETGKPGSTLEDVLTSWRRKNFDLANDAWLVFAADDLVGTTITLNDELGGWVQQVAVRRPWRGRGIALALLHTVFGELY